MAKAKAKISEKSLDVLTKTKKPRRVTKKVEATPTQPKPSRARSRSRTPSRTAKAETIIVPKTEPKKSVGRKPKANNSIGQSKSEPIVKRLDGEVKRTRAAALKNTIPKNSTPKKKPQEISTPTRKQPRRIAAINSGNSHSSSHKMEVDDVDSVVSPEFNHDEVEEVSTGGGGWFSRCCIV